MRCGNCMEPLASHAKRVSAPPICRKGGVYREATQEELHAGYRAAFPDGPQPVAIFRTDDPESMARARAILSPEALSRTFSAGGGGMPAFIAAIEGPAAPDWLDLPDAPRDGTEIIVEAAGKELRAAYFPCFPGWRQVHEGIAVGGCLRPERWRAA